MFDIPVDLPFDHPEHVCLQKAAAKQDIPLEILLAIRIQEGGQKGHVRYNSNGSYDVGVMQINSIHFEEFKNKWGVKPSWLVHGNCYSIFAGAYILRREIDRAGSFWEGVGSYHSRTPSRNSFYRGRIQKILNEHKWDRVALWERASQYRVTSVAYKKFLKD